MPNELFGQNLLKKGPKPKSNLHHRILCIRNSLCTNFIVTWNFEFSTKFTQKGYFRSKKETRKEYSHQILHILVSLGAKFQLQLILTSIICIFVPNLPPKRLIPVIITIEHHNWILHVRLNQVPKFGLI